MKRVDAFILLTMRRCLILAAVTAGACLISKLMSGYIPILLVCAAFPVIEFALFSVRYNAVDVFMKNANIFAYGTGYLFERYYSVRFFGAAHPEGVITAAAVALFAVFSLLAALLPERRKEGAKKLLRLPEKIKLPQIKARPHGLFAWEFVKLLHAPAVLIPVCLCLCLCVWGILKNAPLKQNEGEKLYRGYCAEFSGKSFLEIDGRLAEEEGRILSADARMDEADRLYDSGQMDFDEYNAVSADYIDCLRREGLLPVLRARLDYLIDTSAELNGSLDFVYDTELNKLIGLEKGILPMLAVILLACCPFLKERESGFVNLLRTGKNGRGRIYLVRLAFVLLCAASVTLFFSAAELYALSVDGIFESLKPPRCPSKRSAKWERPRSAHILPRFLPCALPPRSASRSLRMRCRLYLKARLPCSRLRSGGCSFHSRCEGSAYRSRPRIFRRSFRVTRHSQKLAGRRGSTCCRLLP